MKRITAFRMKALFAFTAVSVLAEELGDGAGQYEVQNVKVGVVCSIEDEVRF
ncbi:hypothetical protein AB1K32_14710 [Metabacillus dongyingensis]|uniref:hypothetical protein n=1 Tax=Metabacillus dongyingensis TaxID=2874282 RepID=UPI003B8E1C43